MATATPPSSTLTSAASTRNRSELCDRALAAREQRVVLSDATCSEQSGRVDVVEIQQHGRRDLDEPPTLVGPELEGLRDPKMQSADLELVADRRVETREQARLRPDLTALRSAARVARRRTERVGDLHATSKGIRRAHATDVGKRALVAREHD